MCEIQNWELELENWQKQCFHRCDEEHSMEQFPYSLHNWYLEDHYFLFHWPLKIIKRNNFKIFKIWKCQKWDGLWVFPSYAAIRTGETLNSTNFGVLTLKSVFSIFRTTFSCLRESLLQEARKEYKLGMQGGLKERSATCVLQCSQFWHSHVD